MLNNNIKSKFLTFWKKQFYKTNLNNRHNAVVEEKKVLYADFSSKIVLQHHGIQSAYFFLVNKLEQSNFLRSLNLHQTS